MHHVLFFYSKCVWLTRIGRRRKIMSVPYAIYFRRPSCIVDKEILRFGKKKREKKVELSRLYILFASRQNPRIWIQKWLHRRLSSYVHFIQWGIDLFGRHRGLPRFAYAPIWGETDDGHQPTTESIYLLVVVRHSFIWLVFHPWKSF